MLNQVHLSISLNPFQHISQRGYTELAPHQAQYSGYHPSRSKSRAPTLLSDNCRGALRGGTVVGIEVHAAARRLRTRLSTDYDEETDRHLGAGKLTAAR